MEDADQNTRVVEGAKEYRVATKQGPRQFLRALVAAGGWYAGSKEYARRKRLAAAIGKGTPPTEPEKQEAWNNEPCEFWLSDRLREHARKCITHFLDKGAISGLVDDEDFDRLLIDLGMELKDS